MGISLRRGFLTSALIWHLCVVSMWNAPPTPLTAQVVHSPLVSFYMTVFGFTQNWGMFGATRTFSSHIEAEITFQDGSKKIWQFPGMDGLCFIQKCLEILRRGWKGYLIAYPAAWPDAARYIARQNSSPGHLPQRVELVQRWAAIPPPTEAFHQPLPASFSHSQRTSFFVYRVDPEDLR